MRTGWNEMSLEVGAGGGGAVNSVDHPETLIIPCAVEGTDALLPQVSGGKWRIREKLLGIHSSCPPCARQDSRAYGLWVSKTGKNFTPEEPTRSCQESDDRGPF